MRATRPGIAVSGAERNTMLARWPTCTPCARDWSTRACTHRLPGACTQAAGDELAQSLEGIVTGTRGWLHHLLEPIEGSQDDCVLILEMAKDGPVRDPDLAGELGRGELAQAALANDLDGSVGDFPASFVGWFSDGHLGTLASKYLLANYVEALT
jgi:hypothetical protein